MNIWLVSDTHFGHENIIKYCDRPFSSVHEMNETLVENWNSVVKPNDHIWHLGDVYFPKGFKDGSAREFFKRLNGHKRLILGNHDNGQDQVLHSVFEKIVLWRDWKEHGLLMTHIPLHPNNIIKDRRNVHGHIHQNKSPDKQYINVCVEHTDYKPVNIDSIG